MPLINIDIQRQLDAISNSQADAREKLTELYDLYQYRGKSFDESNIAHFLSALAMTDKIDESANLKRFYQELAEEVITELLTLPFRGSLLNLTAILKSSAKLDIQHEKLKPLAATLLKRNLSRMEAIECLHTGFALIKLNITNSSIFHSLLEQLKKQLTESRNITHITEMLYILSCLFILNPKQSRELIETFQSFLDEHITRDFLLPSSSCDLNNLWIFLTALRLNIFPNISPPSVLANMILDTEFAAITERTVLLQEGASSSAYERRWQDRIFHHFPQLDIQKNVFRGAYESDLLVNDQFNLEIDGDSHYLRQNGDHLALKTSDIVRDKLLAKMGITVIRLPFFELNSLQPHEHKKYLEEKLKPILLSQSSLIQYLDAAPFYPSSASSSTMSDSRTSKEGMIDTSTAMPTSDSFSSFSDDESKEEEDTQLSSLLSTSPHKKLISTPPSQASSTPSSSRSSLFHSSSKKLPNTEFQTVPGRKRSVTLPAQQSTLSTNSYALLTNAPKPVAPSPLRRHSLVDPSSPLVAPKEKKAKKPVHAHSAIKKPGKQQQEKFDLDLLIEEVKAEKARTTRSRSCRACVIL